MTPIGQIPHTFIQGVRDQLLIAGTHGAIADNEMVHVQYAYDHNDIAVDSTGAQARCARLIATLREIA